MLHCVLYAPYTIQLLAIRWREPEVIADDAPAHPSTPIVRSFSHKSIHSSVSVTSNSEQLQQEEGEREEKAELEGSSERQEELPLFIPTPQLLVKALTASLNKVFDDAKYYKFYDY